MKLIFISKPILKTIVTNQEGEQIGKIEYPPVITTKMTRGTDSGRTDVFVGKTVIDGAIISYNNKEATIVRTFLTVHKFLTPDDYHVKVLVDGVPVFEADQLFRKGFRGRDASFYKNGKHFLLQNRFLSNTWEVYKENKIIGKFEAKTKLSLFIYREYVGSDDLSNEELMYLYAIIYRPGSL